MPDRAIPMTGKLRTSGAGLDLIRSFEGFRETSVRLPDGRWMIGHGHVRTAREGVRITEADALDLLRHDLKAIEDEMSLLVLAPLSQNQFDALASLAFNISIEKFKNSDVLRALNAGDELAAAAGFDCWRKALVNGRVTLVDALVRRRAAEKALFLEPMGERPQASTPLVRPLLDAPATSADGLAASPDQADDDGEHLGLSDDGPSALAAAPDIARAVAKLAEQLGEGEPQRSPLEGAPTSLASPEIEVRPASPSQVAAQRLSKILSRVEQDAPGKATKSRSASAKPAEIPEELPNFAQAGAASDEKVLIDDTEIVTPVGSPDDLFSAAVEEERKVRQRQNNAIIGNPRVWSLAPWFAIAILCALGLGIAVVETMSADHPEDLIGSAAPVMIAVFGLILTMSGYYILRRLADED